MKNYTLIAIVLDGLSQKTREIAANIVLNNVLRIIGFGFRGKFYDEIIEDCNKILINKEKIDKLVVTSKMMHYLHNSFEEAGIENKMYLDDYKQEQMK